MNHVCVVRLLTLFFVLLNCNSQKTPNVIVEWMEFACIWEIIGSDVGPEGPLGFLVVFQSRHSSSGILPKIKWTWTAFFPHPFQVIYSLLIRRSAVCKVTRSRAGRQRNHVSIIWKDKRFKFWYHHSAVHIIDCFACQNKCNT